MTNYYWRQTSYNEYMLVGNGQKWVFKSFSELHYFCKVKLDATYPIYYGIGVAILLGWRVWKNMGRTFAPKRASEV